MPMRLKKRMKVMKDKKSNTLERITAAGGVVVDTLDKDSDHKVLLIHRRGVWDLPKGKLEEGESIEECAIREVSEEVGLKTEPTVVAPLIQTYHEYERSNIRYGKTTHWYLMKLNSNNFEFIPQKEEGIEKVEWVPLERAKGKVGYDNLKEVLEEL